MKCETQLVATFEALTCALVAFRKCQEEDSDGGEKITTAEFIHEIFPVLRTVVIEAENLYKETLHEHSKEATVLMHKCILCDKYKDSTCDLFNDLPAISSWGEFELFAERNNGMCIYNDFDKGMAEGFYTDATLGTLANE